MGQKHVRQQVQHAIGPHVTGGLQMTDTTFAAPGKQAGECAKRKLRRRLRLKAWKQKTTAKLRFGAMELMQVATAMHANFKQQEEKGAIVKALRQAHFLDYLPTKDGLVPVSQEEATDMPAGSHRLDPTWTEPKADWMETKVLQDGRGVKRPRPCDWSRLNKLRKAQAEKAQDEQNQDNDKEKDVEPPQPRP